MISCQSYANKHIHTYLTGPAPDLNANSAGAALNRRHDAVNHCAICMEFVLIPL